MADSTAKTGHENPVKMLLTTPSIVTTMPNLTTMTPSLPGEISDENSNKFISYLHQVAGNYEVEVDVIMKDHCYARPWNWKPENIYVKPVKKLFFCKSQSAGASSRDSTNQDEFINVEDCDLEPLVPPYDLAKIKQSMDEFQRVANFVRTEDTDDWEEKIDKILWSPVQSRIFNRIVRILNTERLTRLAKTNSPHEPIFRRTSVDTTAKRFRETLASANWDWRITQWLHSLLFDYLPQDYLAIYLDILQTLRQKVPQLIDKMIAVQPNINSKGSSVTWETLGPLLKKTWDPVGPVLTTNRPKKLPGNPILVVTPNGMSNNISSRQSKWISHLGSLGMVITVNAHLGLTANGMTVLTGLEQLVQSCRSKIQDVRADYPGRPIVLVGFNTGGALACQIAQLEHVTAVVSLGFPYNTADGKRGMPDDTLLDVRCPVMFIIGQNAMLAKVDDIEDMRERMLVPTGLVVVGSADDHLRISTSKKISEKISQSIVDRCILDEIGDFVGGILLQPHPLPLRSANTLNMYDRNRKRRKNSTCSSVDSESQSPNIKKIRSQSPSQQGTVINNNVTGIATNVLPRGALVTLTGTTTGTQTPRRRARPYNQTLPEQLITSRLTPQQNIENSSGGITLNIGSFASLAPVGPIRFEPTSINLQSSSLNKTSNTLKTPNAYIKVSKGNQVNLSGPQSVAKIKMIMPTKKVAHRPMNYKNVNATEKIGESNMVNVLASSNAPLKVNPVTATVTNLKATSGAASGNNLITYSTKSPKSVNLVPPMGKSSMSSSVLFTPKNLSTVTTMTTTSTTITTSTTVADNSLAASCRKHVMFRSYQQQERLPNNTSTSSVTSLPVMPKLRSPKNNRAVPKISVKSTIKPSPQSKIQMPDKSLKVGTRSTNTILNCTTTKNHLNPGLEDLGNILDIPIIIAKDGENLNNFERLSPTQQTPITLKSDGKNFSTANSVGNKVVFINNKNITTSTELQQAIQSEGLNQMISTRAPSSIAMNRSEVTNSAQPTIKYTKIILTKRNDPDDKSSPVILTKTNKRTNKFLVMESNDIKYSQGTTRTAVSFSREIRNCLNNESLNVADVSSNTTNAKQSFIELNTENSKKS